MTKNYSKLIRKLRIKKGLTQAEVAEKIGISRSSYINIEQDRGDLSFSAMQKITNLFGISLCDVESGFSADYPKYKEMILAYLRKATSGDGKIPKTKLAKLLYLADFAWFYKHLKSMSGMQYRRIQHGPVPDSYFRAIDELEEDGKIKVDRKGDYLLISENRIGKEDKMKILSKEELKLIEKISLKWKNKRTNEIVCFTHNQLPYKICQPDEIIPYELITQEDPGYVY